jgi:hypothetical protein
VEIGAEIREVTAEDRGLTQRLKPIAIERRTKPADDMA